MIYHLMMICYHFKGVMEMNKIDLLKPKDMVIDEKLKSTYVIVKVLQHEIFGLQYKAIDVDMSIDEAWYTFIPHKAIEQFKFKAIRTGA